MQQTQTLKIMWLAFMVSIGLFQVVAIMAAPPAQGVELTLVAALAFAAVLTAAFGTVGVGMALRSTPAQSAFIVRFACFEAVSLFGFVLAFTSGNTAFSISAAVVAWLLMLTAFPSDERFTAWEVRRLGDEGNAGDDRP